MTRKKGPDVYTIKHSPKLGLVRDSLPDPDGEYEYRYGRNPEEKLRKFIGQYGNIQSIFVCVPGV